MVRRLLGAAACAAALMLIAAPALAKAPFKSSVYCIATRRAPGLQVFDYRVQGNGDLEFNFEDWTTEAQRFGADGVARKRGAVWVYESDLGAPDPADRCRITIALPKDGSAILRGDKTDQCRQKGGSGTGLTFLRFPSRVREGPVPAHLDLLNGDEDVPIRCNRRQLPSRY